MEGAFDGRGGDRLQEWGPLNVWSSRLREVRDRIYFGAYVLDRESNDTGGAAGRDLHVIGHCTTDRLTIRDKNPNGANPAGMPIQDRYYGSGSFARMTLPLDTVFGAGTMSRVRGAWVQFTAYEPANSNGTRPVRVTGFHKDGAAWVTAGDLVGAPGNSLEVKFVFQDTGDREPSSWAHTFDVLDQTAFLDDVSVKVLTPFEILHWSEFSGE